MSPDGKEIWVTITGSEVISLGLLSGSNEDGVDEFASADRIVEQSESSHADGNTFDADMAADGIERTGKARDDGNIAADPPEANVNHFFMKAGGALYLEAESGDTKSEIRQIQNQADWLYYSGHGYHDSGMLASANFLPFNAAGNWDKDLETVIIAGCSVLDVNDYEGHYSGSEHTDSPGEKWEPTGPSVFLGYNYEAPLDVGQNTDGIIADWVSGRGTLGEIPAWREANNNSNGRNACAIAAGVSYFYFKKYLPLVYVWTEVPKAAW